MPKEYQINGVRYVFSKDKFQEVVKQSIKDKRSSGDKYSAANFYLDLAEAIHSSEETVRKWYSKGGPSPADIALVEAIAEYAGLSDVKDLLEKEEDSHMMNMEIVNNPDRELVEQIHNEMMNFAEQLANGVFSERIKTETIEWDSWNMKKIFNALLQIHLIIDKASMDIKSETAKKLHDIVLTYTENVRCHEVAAKWDPLMSDDYLLAREVLVHNIQWDCLSVAEDEKDELGLKEYLRKIYPTVYDDEEDFLEIPFSPQYIYLREFAITLNNVFRNDFPEYFLYE